MPDPVGSVMYGAYHGDGKPVERERPKVLARHLEAIVRLAAAVERLDKELPGTLGRLGAGKELPGEVRVAFAALEVVLGLSGEFRQVAELADQCIDVHRQVVVLVAQRCAVACEFRGEFFRGLLKEGHG